MKCVNCNADSKTELCSECTDSYKRLRDLVTQGIEIPEPEYTDEAVIRQKEYFKEFNKNKNKDKT